MNYKKILSIFLVVASLFVTVGANSGLICFAGRYYTESEQRERDIREMKRLLKLMEKAEAKPAKQKSPSLWSSIKFMFKSHFAAIVGIAGSMASIFAIIGGIFGAVTSYKCYVDSGSFTCSGLSKFIKKYKDTIGSNASSILGFVQDITRNIHIVITPQQS